MAHPMNMPPAMEEEKKDDDENIRPGPPQGNADMGGWGEPFDPNGAPSFNPQD